MRSLFEPRGTTVWGHLLYLWSKALSLTWFGGVKLNVPGLQRKPGNFQVVVDMSITMDG